MNNELQYMTVSYNCKNTDIKQSKPYKNTSDMNVTKIALLHKIISRNFFSFMGVIVHQICLDIGSLLFWLTISFAY